MSNIRKHFNLLREMNPFLFGNVLDYGCGDGTITGVLAILISPQSNFFAYDGPETGGHDNQSMLYGAKVRLRDKVSIIERREDLPEEYFDAITLICMLHGNEKIIEQCDPYLKRGGHLIVLDHDKKHLSEREYVKYITDADLREISQRSYNEVLRDHTRMNVSDCCRITRRIKYRTEKVLDHRNLGGYPFYLCISKKN